MNVPKRIPVGVDLQYLKFLSDLHRGACWGSEVPGYAKAAVNKMIEARLTEVLKKYTTRVVSAVFKDYLKDSSDIVEVKLKGSVPTQYVLGENGLVKIEGTTQK